MTTKEELRALIEEQRKDSVSGVFEISNENMKTLRQLFDEHSEIFCPTPDTTFEQFCGYMVVAGTNFLQREFVKFSMKKMFDDLTQN